jgi:hypothetical protein
LASAAKSIFSCILGIAIADGKLPSADAKIVDYYPEAMDVPEGEGPKPGRYAFEKDRHITFRQLIISSPMPLPSFMASTVSRIRKDRRALSNWWMISCASPFPPIGATI